MKRKPVAPIVVVSIILLALFGTVPVSADDAPGVGSEGEREAEWEARFRNAKWVSHLRIEGLGSLIVPSMSRPRLKVVQGYRYSALVVKAWKGDQNGSIRFRVDLGDCQEPLEVDREYVVFGSVDHRGHLQSRSCDHLVAIENAGPLLIKLNALSHSHQIAGQSGS